MESELKVDNTFTKEATPLGATALTIDLCLTSSYINFARKNEHESRGGGGGGVEPSTSSILPFGADVNFSRDSIRAFARTSENRRL